MSVPSAINIYNVIVYTVLMTSINNDFRESSPDYFTEKARILALDERDGYGFGYLDIHNMGRAIAYCEKWKLPLPESWSKEKKLQDEAAEELAHAGFNL